MRNSILKNKSKAFALRVIRLYKYLCDEKKEYILSKQLMRYVDTFEEEEPIDIHAVMKEIKELEAKRADLDKEIEGYMKELGII